MNRSDLEKQNQALLKELELLKAENSRIKDTNISLQKDNHNLRCKNNYLKRKLEHVKIDLCDLKRELDTLKSKYDLSDKSVEKLKECASELPLKLFQTTVKRISGKRVHQFDPVMKKFALSLHLCSSKAYRYVVIHSLSHSYFT